MDLAEQVGWPRETAKWRLLLTLGVGHCTRAGDALTSMVMIIPHDEGCFVAMMVVAPDQHGRGLGRALLEHALSEAPRPVMLYATPKGRPLYEKLGFVAVDEVIRFEGSPRHTPSRTSPLVHAETIIARDARAFGIARPRMVRELLAIADRVVADDGGFAIRFFNGATSIVGPVVAASQEAAIALIDDAWVGTSTHGRIDVPVSSPRVAAHLEKNGFCAIARAPFMTWPNADRRGDRVRYHAIALQALG